MVSRKKRGHTHIHGSFSSIIALRGYSTRTDEEKDPFSKKIKKRLIFFHDNRFQFTYEEYSKN